MPKPPFLNMDENRREVNSRSCITLQSRGRYTSFFAVKKPFFILTYLPLTVALMAVVFVAAAVGVGVVGLTWRSPTC